MKIQTMYRIIKSTTLCIETQGSFPGGILVMLILISQMNVRAAKVNAFIHKIFLNMFHLLTFI